jgi:hypothetical protein
MRPVPDYLEELRDQVPRLGSERDALGVKTRIQAGRRSATVCRGETSRKTGNRRGHINVRFF